jgi:hypothetical protein
VERRNADEVSKNKHDARTLTGTYSYQRILLCGGDTCVGLAVLKFVTSRHRASTYEVTENRFKCHQTFVAMSLIAVSTRNKKNAGM